VGERIYEDLSVAVIIKNIRSGKLKPEHEIARAGSESWMELGKVPQLEKYFIETAAALAATPEPVHAPQPKPRYFDVLRGKDIGGPFTRQQVAAQISRGELTATDRVRPHGSEYWQMAGDTEDLRRYFDLRRNQVREKGFLPGGGDTGAAFYKDLGVPFIYYGNLRFLFNLIAILLFFGIAYFIQIPIVAGPLTILTSLYLYSYYFRVVGNASTGGKTFPEFSDISDLSGGLIRPAVQFFLTTLVSTLPLVLYLVVFKLGPFDFYFKLPYIQVIYSIPWAILLMPAPAGYETIPLNMPTPTGEEVTIMEQVIPTSMAGLGSDPLIWIFLLLWFLYVPIALMRQAAYGEFMPTFNLPAVFISIARAFGPYMALLAFMLAIDLLAGSLLFVLVFIVGLSTLGPAGAGALTVLTLPFQLALQAIGICATFLKMYFIGRFVFQYSEKMGWH